MVFDDVLATKAHHVILRPAVTLTFDLQNLIRSSALTTEYSMCFICLCVYGPVCGLTQINMYSLLVSSGLFK